MKLKILLLTLFLSTSFIGVTYADYKAGVDAFGKGDYKIAFKEFLPLAEEGNSSAQYIIGRLYRLGQGVLKDYKEAAKWYKKAAEQDHSLISDYEFRSEMYLINIHKAQYYLGLMYENGKGVLKDHEKAIKSYKKAIDLICNESSGPEDWYSKVIDDEDVIFGDDASEWHILCEPKDHLFPEDHIFGTLTSACYNLGMKYFRGEGVLKDNDEAEKYFWEGFWKGDVRSSYMLHMVDTIEDYFRDDTREFSLLTFSAGAFIFSHTNTGGTDNSKHFNLNDIESYKKAVRKGYAKSQYLLGTIYTEIAVIMEHLGSGSLGEVSDARKGSISKYWIKKAYENSDTGIRKKADDFWNKHELWKYEDHIGPNNEPTDDEKIKNIISIDNKSEESSLTGISGGSAFISIGRRFINGDGILKDPIKAIKYYKKAIEHSNIKEDQRDLMDAKAKFELGVIYYEENSVKDYTESKYWINKAYESSDAIINKKAEDFWNKNKLWNY